jgi:hypothetical protein
MRIVLSFDRHFLALEIERIDKVKLFLLDRNFRPVRLASPD